MTYDCFPQDIQDMIRNPFVFVSYCHDDKDVFNRVRELVMYLRNRNLTVVYDEGGLAAGTELTQFENLILHNNCKYVLVVCDKNYIKKVSMMQGGVWREYFTISNDYLDNVRKYIPLKVNEQLPIFKSKIYIDFSQTSAVVFSNIENELKSLKVFTTNTIKKNESLDKVVELADKAFDLLEEKDYNAANRKIDEAIKVYGNRKRTQNSVWAQLYNLKLSICISQGDANTSVEFAEKLRMKISNRIARSQRIKYFVNCALAYRLQNKQSSLYEEYAKSAYSLAKKEQMDDLDYYACMYATSLFETEQYSLAYKTIKEALQYFEQLHPQKDMWDKDTLVLNVKIKGNIAEIATDYSKSIEKNRNKKYCLLLEAKNNIVDALNIIEDIEDDAIWYESCSIASKVFGELKKYFA